MIKSDNENLVCSPPRPVPPRNYAPTLVSLDMAVTDDPTTSSSYSQSDVTLSACDLSFSSNDQMPPKPPPPLSYTSTLPPPCPSPSPRSKRSRTLPHKKNKIINSHDIEVTII